MENAQYKDFWAFLSLLADNDLLKLIPIAAVLVFILAAAVAFYPPISNAQNRTVYFS